MHKSHAYPHHVESVIERHEAAGEINSTHHKIAFAGELRRVGKKSILSWIGTNVKVAGYNRSTFIKRDSNKENVFEK